MPARKTNETTVSAVVQKLNYLHLTAMSETLQEMNQSGELYCLTPLEVLDQLASLQVISSKNGATERYKKRAKLYQPMADLGDILYQPERHINVAMINQLATNEYIANSRNVLITSATGCGKTFLACAFGNNACEQQYTVRYFTMTEFMDECHRAEDKGKYVKFLRNLSNTDLIIMDDFLLTGVTSKEVEYLYRLFNERPRRKNRKSFIICSQLMKEEMYTRMSTISPSLADAIVNRITARAYEIELQGRSMREVDIPAELERIKQSRIDQ